MTQPTSAHRAVAAFDFDGTISRRDTLGPFLAGVSGAPTVAWTLLRHAPSLAMVAAGRADRDTEKERVIGALLSGRTAESIEAAGREYAATLWSRQRFRPESLARLQWHRDAGHTIVIVSASLDVYLRPLAPHLGVDHVISCSLDANRDGFLTGRLVGGNCRGPEKARRLREWLGSEPTELWAYGNSSGDNELLAMADHPTRI